MASQDMDMAPETTVTQPRAKDARPGVLHQGLWHKQMSDSVGTRARGKEPVIKGTKMR